MLNPFKGPAFAIMQTVPVFMRSLFHDFDPVSVGPELNRTQLKAVIMVHRGINTTMSMLSRLLDIEKGSTTTLVDALERNGLVVRVRDAKDRRTIRLKLTEKGTEYALRGENSIHQHINRKLSVMTEEEKKELVEAIRVLSRTAQRIADV